MKRLQRSLTASRSSALCFTARAGHVVQVDVGRLLTAHVTNVARCGSPWACAVCAPVVRQRRAEEIDAALHRHLDGGGGALFVTLTLRHHRGDTLASRLDVIARSLHHVLSGEPWKRRRDALGYVGTIKAVEVTWGEANGWHPHSHSLLLTERPVTEMERADLEQWMHGRWSAVAERRGLGTVTRAHGVDVRQVKTAGTLSEYLTVIESAWSPGLELARSDLKRWTPFDLLREVLATGEARPVALWLEYERASFGKRAVVWSPGLRQLLCGVEVEATDEELASSEGIDLGLIRALVPGSVWNQTVRDATTGELLTDIERAAGCLLFIADTLGHYVRPLELDTKAMHDAEA